jgi:hypothetical protein
MDSEKDVRAPMEHFALNYRLKKGDNIILIHTYYFRIMEKPLTVYKDTYCSAFWKLERQTTYMQL